MKIIILGATSQIAQDLILSFSKNKDYNFLLFGRNVELLSKWIDDENLSDKCQVQKYFNFNNNQKYDVIINFVGIGDPVKAQNMGFYWITNSNKINNDIVFLIIIKIEVFLNLTLITQTQS